jgi:tetratricopeptide (TPR) repeat protein
MGSAGECVVRLRGFVLAACLAGCLAGCASTSVRESASGQIVVEARRAQTFDDLAREVYGDATLGRAVAEANRMPYAEGVPQGALLVLPPKEGLGDRVADERRADELFRAGLAAADAGAWHEAAESFRESLAITPGRGDVLYNLGLALMQAGDYEAATSALEEAREERPDDPEIHYALGSLYRKRRAWQRALDEFDATLRGDHGHAKAAFARARTLADLGETAEAEHAYREFLRDFPKDGWADRARQELAVLEAGAAESGAPVEP